MRTLGHAFQFADVVKIIISGTCLVVLPLCRADSTPPPAVVSWGSRLEQYWPEPWRATNTLAVSASTPSNSIIFLKADRTLYSVKGPYSQEFPDAPANLNKVVAIDSGLGFHLALKSDGEVVGWGYPGVRTADTSGISNLVAIAAGPRHALGVTSEGKVAAWGDDNLSYHGVLEVPPGLQDVVAVSAGLFYSMALKRDGTVAAWGLATKVSALPQGLSDVVAIAGGEGHVLALKRDGTVVAWGIDSAYTNYPHGLTNIVAVAGGCTSQVCAALRQDGALFLWGYPDLMPPAIFTNITPIKLAQGAFFANTRAPILARQPSSHLFTIAGDNLFMNIEAWGSDSWDTYWFHDNNLIPEARSTSLVLSNIVATQSGDYSCLLSNSFGHIRTHTAVGLYPFITESPRSQKVFVGDEVVFRVAATGTEPLKYQWFKNDQVLSGETNQLLMISSASVEDLGYYRVNVRNDFLEIRSDSVQLEFNASPEVTNPQGNLALPAGSEVFWKADVAGETSDSFQWQHNGTNLPGQTYSVLVLQNLQASHSGVFAVITARGPDRRTNIFCNLAITESAPVVVLEPVPATLSLRSRGFLQVKAWGSEPLSYQWHYNGSRIEGATNRVLVFPSTGTTDGGSYFVAVSNHLGHVQTKPVNVTTTEEDPALIDPPCLALDRLGSVSIPGVVHLVRSVEGSGWHVVEHAGQVHRVPRSFDSSSVFLDMRPRLIYGLAFSPGYATNRQFYLNCSRAPDGRSVLSRFKTDPISGTASNGTEEVLLTLPDTAPGGIAFGADGLLYVATSTGKNLHTAQDPGSLLGKILRIDVEAGIKPYAIPANNPFLHLPEFAPEIWALGLSGPWPITFDRASGDLYLCDPGPFYQEVNFQPANTGGQNYGWPIREGPYDRTQIPGVELSTLVPPIAGYSIQNGGVTAGYVYRGTQFPRMNGWFFYGDALSGDMWGAKRFGSAWLQYRASTGSIGISTFGEDETGEILVADYYQGGLYRLKDTFQVVEPVLDPPIDYVSASRTIHSNTVLVACATPGASIHFTQDGRIPTELDPLVGADGSVTVRHGAPLKVRAFRPDLTPSATVTARYLLRVATPQASPENGVFTNGTLISLSCLTPSSTIHYGFDNWAVSSNNAAFASPFPLEFSASGLVKLVVIAYAEGLEPSFRASFEYHQARAATPKIRALPDPATNFITVVMTCESPGGTVFYHTNATVPHSEWLLYTAPVSFLPGTTLYARATAPGHLDSESASIKLHGPFTLGSFESAIVSTFAGSPASGYRNGFRRDARFFNPEGICINRDGHLYVADTGNKAIRRIDSRGYVSTYAGDPRTSDRKDGPIESASFLAPRTITSDHQGNLYVIDNGSVLRRIGIDGMVSTVLYTGYLYSDAIVAPDGSIFAGGSSAIQTRLSGAGPVSYFAGSWANCVDGWANHVGLARDYFGSIYALTEFRVWRIDTEGIPELFAGSDGGCFLGAGYADGPRLLARFTSPGFGFADSIGNLFVTEPTRLRKVSQRGWVSTSGSGDLGYLNGPAETARFADLRAVCADTNGVVYVVDRSNHCIRAIHPDSTSSGMPDSWQMWHFGYLGADPSADADQDGATNMQEYLADTSPIDPASRLALRAERAPAGTVNLRWTAGTNAVTVLQRAIQSGSSALVPNWLDIRTNLGWSSVSGSWTENPTNRECLFRIRIEH